MLAVLTGPVRSGKSSAGLALALASGRPVCIVVGARADDEEMARRIGKHQAGRPDGIAVVEAAGDPGWTARVPSDACLLIDCLGTVLGWTLAGLETPGDVVDEPTETAADDAAAVVVRWIVSRDAPTVVVTNEVGWGVVPATPLGRLFRDVLGRANRLLVEAADAAWLVVAGRCIDLKDHPTEVTWTTL